MTELLRRILALALLCLGGYLILWPGGKVLIIQPENFKSGYERHVQQSEKVLNFDEYIQKITKGRTTEVNSPTWNNLTSKLNYPENSPALMAKRFGMDNKRFIFRPNDQPFDALSSFPLETTTYLSVNKGDKWLAVRAAYVQDIYGLPSKFLYPLRHLGAFLAITAFLLYALIPRKVFAEDEIHYPQGLTVITPDIMGLILTTVFFLLPFPIVWSMKGGVSVLSVSQGWIGLTLAMWLLAAICLLFLRVGLNYSILSYRITDEGLREIRGQKDTLLRWTEIDYYQSYKTRTSTKLAHMLLHFGSSFQSIGMGIALDGNEEYGINVVDRNGRKIKIMANTLNGFEDIVNALKKHGIKRKRKKAPQ
ncbi:hypothetical protein [Maridesulfovibrio hydrothermalis]|uniref:PH domain-containing protein n=1 Tax=Maridesulfovibrio hydrothermalis AM13 = DSM 14728 TaxID=1121451 RepID=L0RD75_9BACT|nr:hypothetical protein [Maridesulfovibrio hydrothermalis]CCO23496.1 conserved membrane protein of unknown function [Maridesulfovibrio hydrothermalis AM13 = DSM 14728]